MVITPELWTTPLIEFRKLTKKNAERSARHLNIRQLQDRATDTFLTRSNEYVNKISGT